ncbi:hypothetical protein HDV06_007113 [Boothiomyces sp. JEL0866]|nr:hypothetical protein HDV06_007113 [Boothiomyces sp. JEL0866]
MALVFESLWNTFDCSGPPASFYILNASQLSQGFVGDCGLDPFPRADGAGCCVSSVDLSFTNGIASSLYTTIGDYWSVDNAAPTSANGNSYCKVDYTNAGKQLFHINSGYYLNTGKCEYGSICNGTHLSIFQTLDCKTKLGVFPINPQQPTRYYTNTLKNITVSLVSFSNAKNYVDWIFYIPGYEVVPNNSTTVEKLGLAGLVLGLLGSASCFLYLLYYTVKVKKEKNTMFSIGITLCNFTRSLAQIYYIYYILDADTIGIIEILLLFGRFPYLFSNYFAADLLFKLYGIYSSVFKKTVIYGLIIFYFIAILPLFTATIAGITGNIVLFNSMASIQSSFVDSYLFFTFVFNLMPLVALFLTIVGQYSKQQKKKQNRMTLKSLIIKYRIAILLFAIQILSIVTHVAFFIVTKTSLFLGNDMSAMASSGIYFFLEQLNTLVMIILYQYLRNFTKELVKPGRAVQKKEETTAEAPLGANTTNQIDERTVKLNV